MTELHNPRPPVAGNTFEAFVRGGSGSGSSLSIAGNRNVVSMRGDTWKEEWPVAFLCRVMQVTSRGYRAWRVRPMSQRQRDDMVILAHIREQHRLSLQSYRRPRVTEELQELGVNVGPS